MTETKNGFEIESDETTGLIRFTIHAPNLSDEWLTDLDGLRNLIDEQECEPFRAVLKEDGDFASMKIRLETILTQIESDFATARSPSSLSEERKKELANA